MSTELKYLIANAALILVGYMFAKQFQQIGNKIVSQREKILKVTVYIFCLIFQFILPIYGIIYTCNNHPFNKQYVDKIIVFASTIAFYSIYNILLYLWYFSGVQKAYNDLFKKSLNGFSESIDANVRLGRAEMRLKEIQNKFSNDRIENDDKDEIIKDLKDEFKRINEDS
ncbi:MAG: hypothetical protein M3352_12335 [Bacteroidota bacterium]|nr:hypothetical protein [Bacteroidota bacterium]